MGRGGKRWPVGVVKQGLTTGSYPVRTTTPQGVVASFTEPAEEPSLFTLLQINTVSNAVQWSLKDRNTLRSKDG